jgi:hypothetical protein
MRCKPIVFHNVPPVTFDCMKKKLHSEGIKVPSGNKGELSGLGVVADFEWDGCSVLTVTIKEKPFFISCEVATYKIRQFVIECHGS